MTFRVLLGLTIILMGASSHTATAQRRKIRSDKPVKIGKSLCIKKRKSYVAVLRDRKTRTLVPVGALAKRLKREMRSMRSELSPAAARKQIKKLRRQIKKLRSHASTCKEYSAPQAEDTRIVLKTNSSRNLEIPVESEFAGEFSVEMVKQPLIVSVSGEFPLLTVRSGSQSGTDTVVFRLKRKRFSSEVTLTVEVRGDNATNPETPTPSGTLEPEDKEPKEPKEPGASPTPDVNSTPTPPPVATPQPTQTPAPTPTSVPLSAIGQNVEVFENSSSSISLKATGSGQISFQIVEQPKHGTLTGTAPELSYTVGHKSLTDSFTFRVSNGNETSQTATVRINVQSRGAEFAGVASSLEPYRNNVTEAEIAHLCRNVAFGCSYEEIQYGVQIGLEAFIEYLVNFEPDNPDSILSLSMAQARNGDNEWTSDGAQKYWLPYLTRGNALKERLALFWHDHFAVDLSTYSSNDRRHHWIPQHLDFIRGEALGSFETLFEGMHSDPAMTLWLDNQNNYYAGGEHRRNENYAREVLELFSMGVSDFYSAQPNYTEDDMRELSKALSGIRLRTDSSTNTQYVTFVQNNWVPGSKTLFPGKQWESIGDYNFQTVNTSLLYTHPGTARNIAGKLVRIFVDPDPAESMVQQLAEQLVNSEYQVLPVVKRLMSSSAMFSTAARYSCVRSPAEQGIGLFRSLSIPITKVSTVDRLRVFLRDAGQEIVEPPSVFGWQGCGVGGRAQDRAIGDSWLGSVTLLERQKELTQILRHVESQESATFLDRLLPGASATEMQVVERVALLIGNTLSAEEKQLLVEFLNTEHNNGNTVNSPWDPGNRNETRAKVAGLVLILALHPTGLTR